MIIPQYWAEGRVRHRDEHRQVTVRRFGWSDESQAAAQAMADERAREALARTLAGEDLPRREPKVPYNGAEGVPIREEVVSRHRGAVITRNSYGAKCLNTPHVFFADVDFLPAFSMRGCLIQLSLLLMAAGLVMANATTAAGAFGGAVAVMVLGPVVLGVLRALIRRLRGGYEQIALARVRQFSERHPHWHLRLYRTPAGLRVMALHKTFDPRDPEVAAAFAALQADPVYVRMCQRQNCFRARVSPKPWRIGIGDHLRPRRGVWPVAPERLAERQAWLAHYDVAASGFAACALVETLGSGVVHPEARQVMELHDELCQVQRQLPIA